MKIEKSPKTVYYKGFNNPRGEIYRKKTATPISLFSYHPWFLILDHYLFAKMTDIFLFTRKK